MAQEIWTYKLYWNESQNYGLNQNKRSVSMTLRRVDHLDRDPSLYTLASTHGAMSSSGSKLSTYVSPSQTLNFGGYAYVDVGPSASRWDFANEDAYSIPSSILNVDYNGVSIAVSTSASLGSGNAVYFYGGNSGTEMFTLTITVESKYSPSTFTASNVEFGQVSTVYISNQYISEMDHQVVWSCGGTDHSVSLGAGVSSASFTIPTSWMNKVPSATSITCTIYVHTYRSGRSVGTNTRTITITVPASVKPTISGLTATLINEKQQIPGQYIQNMTGVQLQVGNVAAGDYASLTTYTLSMTQAESYTFDSANRRYTISRLQNSGPITFSVVVKDSRGRQSDPVAVSISVLEYSPPTIMATSAFRCNASGIAQESGTFASIRITASYTPLQGNTVTINSVYYESTTPSTTYVARNGMISGEEYVVGGGNLNQDNNYYIRFTITDSLGGSATETALVQSSSYVFHIKNGGSGIAMGKTCEKYSAVEIYKGWDLWYKGVRVLPVVYSTSAPSDPDTHQPFEGLVWLKPKES